MAAVEDVMATVVMRLHKMPSDRFTKRRPAFYPPDQHHASAPSWQGVKCQADDGSGRSVGLSPGPLAPAFRGVTSPGIKAGHIRFVRACWSAFRPSSDQNKAEGNNEQDHQGRTDQR